MRTNLPLTIVLITASLMLTGQCLEWGKVCCCVVLGLNCREPGNTAGYLAHSKVNSQVQLSETCTGHPSEQPGQTHLPLCASKSPPADTDPRVSRMLMTATVIFGLGSEFSIVLILLYMDIHRNLVGFVVLHSGDGAESEGNS